MLENLGKTVCITGAMLPMERFETDARRNLMISFVVAAVSNIPEVVVVFRDYVFRGCRTKKVDSSSMNAFQSPNFPPLAVVEDEMQVRRSLLLKHPGSNGKLIIQSEMENSIAVIRLVPGFRNDFLLFTEQASTLKGLILELYGAGNAPKSLELTQLVNRVVARGVIVVIVSQCSKGFVDLQAYESGKRMLDCGAISAGDITLEACAMKLSYLLGKYKHDKKKVIEGMKSNLRGELTQLEKSEARFQNSIVVRDVDYLAAARL